MSIDITSKLLSQGITSVSNSNISSVSNPTSSTADTAAKVRTDFSTWLQDEITKLKEDGADASSIVNAVTTQIGELNGTGTTLTESDELKMLMDSLDKSILGSVASTLDTKEAASELFTGEGSDKVIKQLVSGHLNSIVMTDSDDLEDADDSLESSVTETFADTSTETLAQNLETIMEHLNQLSE